MKKTLLFGLLAGSLMLSATSCSNFDEKKDEDVANVPLPPIPAAPDTTGGKKAPATPATREINSVNAVDDIKKMQPTM